MLLLRSIAIACGVLNCPGPVPVLAPRLHPVAVLVVLGDARVDVAVADVDVALRVPGDVGRLAEQAVDRAAAADRRAPTASVSSSADSFRRPNTITTRPAWLNLMIMSEPLSMAQMLSSLSMRTRVRERPAVQALADLADEFALGTELEQLRRGRRVRRDRRRCSSA